MIALYIINHYPTTHFCLLHHMHSFQPLHFHYHSLLQRETPQEMTRAFIPSWIVVKVLLMIRLRIPPLPRRQNLRYNLPLPPLLIHLLRDLSCDPFLFRIMVENTRSILRTSIWTLTVGRCGIVHLVEEFEELAVCYLLWIVGYLECFGVCCSNC